MAKLICKDCGQPISGQFIQALGAVWHPACFRCAHCKEPIDSCGFLEKRGKAYHPRCYHERFSPHCHACKQPIEGHYIKALGKLWHPEHFVCAHCGNPIEGKYFAHRGKPYCAQDYLLLFGEKCTLCGKPLDERFMVDIWGNKYCQHHENEPRCSSCNRFIGMTTTGQAVRYEDNRIICEHCNQSAIFEISKAYELLQEVQDVLARHELIFNRKYKIPLNMVGQAELQSALAKRKRLQNASGITQTGIETLFGVESSREIKNIQVLYGLPREHLGAVLAHELGHVWLFLNRYPQLPGKLEEGICELMSSYWLQTQENELAKIRLKLLEKNPHRIYGTGYRTVRKAVERTSLAYVLDNIKRYASLPKK
jgi:hypothetical protein